MTNWDFPVTEPIRLDASLPSGDATIIAGPGLDTATVSLEPLGGKRAQQIIDEAEVSFSGGTLLVRVQEKMRLLGNASVRLEVHLPERSAVQIRTASGDIRCEGELSDLTARSASGDVVAGVVTGLVKLDSASGDLRLTHGGGDVVVKTASGDAEIRTADGDVSLESASGDLRLGQAGGSARARTASGDVHIDSIRSGRADVNTATGDVTVGVPSGVGVYLDLYSLSGDVRSDLAETGAESGAELTIGCRTISGDIRVIQAAG
jgi:DUF4097 and DUF4098 domain-containing protein YvlB